VSRAPAITTIKVIAANRLSGGTSNPKPARISIPPIAYLDAAGNPQ